MNAFHASIFVGLTRFFMSLLNAWLLKRFKRRPLVMVSTIGMTLTMFVSGLFTKWTQEGRVNTISWNPFKLIKCFYSLRDNNIDLGTSDLPPLICLLFHDWSVDDSLDNDSWIIPERNSRNGSFHLLFNGQFVDVLRRSIVQVRWLINCLSGRSLEDN